MEQTKPLRLLKKWQKGLWNLLFSRMALVIALLMIQIGLLLSAFAWFRDFLPHIIGGQFLLTAGMLLHLISHPLDPTAKLTWFAVIAAAPVFGSLLYLFRLKEFGHRVLGKRIRRIASETRDLPVPDASAKSALEEADPGAAALCEYVRRASGYPLWTNTDVTYFPLGQDKFQRLLEELEQAKDFIFLEYFIIEEGLMWGRILEILARKAAQGVDVRVLYDGTCEFTLLPRGYNRKLEALGIRCKVFSPFVPLVSTYHNFRDHRKILIIDGHTAFNGGVNLADEYINAKERFGHWKDTAAMLKGKAVQNFTLMFLQNWSIDEKNIDFSNFLNSPTTEATGFVMPYGDDPLAGHRVGQRVYLDLLNRARRRVSIMTPYLILDAETENALKYAAARGVTVELILPGIPDKKIPYALAKTHYKALLDAGVEIYEYTPGFVHAKVFLVDDREAVVGTINLDYRSLLHHFECATWMWGVECLRDIREDFTKTLSQCRRVTEETQRREKRSLRLIGYLFKLFAPLL